MIHAATDEVLEHLWYAAEEGRLVNSFADLRFAAAEGSVPDQALENALHSLRQHGSVELNGPWRLSIAGERKARGIVRRHRLAEVMFVHAFGTDLREAEVSACEMEHMLSESVADRVCTFLGHPPVCPHGKQVPGGDCCRVYSRTVDPLITRLIDAPVGSTVSITCIAPAVATRIQRLATFGVIPGTAVRIVSRWPSCVISCGGSSIALDDDIGRDIYVRRESAG